MDRGSMTSPIGTVALKVGVCDVSANLSVSFLEAKVDTAYIQMGQKYDNLRWANAKC